jgi:hypothetical protein
MVNGGRPSIVDGDVIERWINGAEDDIQLHRNHVDEYIIRIMAGLRIPLDI